MCDFGWSLKTEVMGRFDFCDAKMLREGCFKKYIQAPLIGMRIWFGLILKIMLRTKSKIEAKGEALEGEEREWGSHFCS